MNNQKNGFSQDIFEEKEYFQPNNDNLELSQAKSMISGEKEDETDMIPIPPEIMPFYLRYAKNYFLPSLCQEAANEVYIYFTTVMEQQHQVTSLPFNSNLVETIVKLSQARAKIDLQNTVTATHVKEVCILLTETMYDQLIPIRDSNIDNPFKKGGYKMIKRVDLNDISSFSVPTQMKYFMEQVRELEILEFYFQDLKSLAQKMNMKVPQGFKSFLHDVLIDQMSYFLDKGNNMYILQE